METSSGESRTAVLSSKIEAIQPAAVLPIPKELSARIRVAQWHGGCSDLQSRGALFCSTTNCSRWVIGSTGGAWIAIGLGVMVSVSGSGSKETVEIDQKR